VTKYLVKATIKDRKGRVLSEAYNSYVKTHPKQKRFARLVGKPRCEYLHAEVAAIIRALKVGVPYSIFVERRTMKTGRVGLAKPCAICQLAIQEVGIKIVEYTGGGRS